jgi:DNA integrity scanning protein DisA with diadenylate cyclase activity
MSDGPRKPIDIVLREIQIIRSDVSELKSDIKNIKFSLQEIIKQQSISKTLPIQHPIERGWFIW